ncbi:MAG: ABC-type transport auxiliary lipoprotein family protein [Erythrobacter sp.]
MRSIAKPARRMLALALLAGLSGCVSLGGAKAPASLLTLTPEAAAPAGSALSAASGQAIALHDITLPAEIDVLRVPVQVDATSVAYLKDALWVERPGQLIRRLLAETIRVRTQRVVLGGSDPLARGALQLRSQVNQFGYDAARSAVVVQIDAMLVRPDGTVRQQRFEAVEPGVIAQPGPVGAALNRAANLVARDIADWSGQ